MSYGFKLLCLSLAAFFIVHFAAAMVVNWLAPAAIRAAGRMRAHSAARFLLMVRLAPVAIAILAVAALCVPSYIRFEPDAEAEQVGWACLIAAMLSIAVCATSLVRGVRAILKSRRWLRDLKKGTHYSVPDPNSLNCPGAVGVDRAVRPLFQQLRIVEGNTVALAGLIAPRVIVSREVIRTLSPAEFDAALRHERAHADSRDNLKRLLMLLAPDALPFFPARFPAIERAARKFSEWAADDRAVNGDPERSVALASALVRVARMAAKTVHAAPHPSPLVTSLIDGDLTARVDRLLSASPQGEPDRFTPMALVLGGIALASLLVRPGALISVYELLERLMK